MSCGLVRGWSLEKAHSSLSSRLGAQFQCRLFFFGPGIDIGRSCRFLGASYEVSLFACLVVWVGLFLAPLVLTIAV